MTTMRPRPLGTSERTDGAHQAHHTDATPARRAVTEAMREPDVAAEQRRRRLLARIALVWSLMSLVTEITPIGYWLDSALPESWYAISWVATGLPSVTFAVFLFLVSSGLRRGRRAALLLFVFGAGAAGPLGWLAVETVNAGDTDVPVWFWFAVALQVGLLVTLWQQRRYFAVPTERIARRGVWGVLGLALVTLVVGGTALVGLTDSGRASVVQRAGYVLQRAVADMGVWPWEGDVRVPWWSNLLINTLAALLVAAVLYLALRPCRRERELTIEDEAHLRRLLSVHGARDSLGYFALRRDKSVVFSPSGKAAITYRVLGGVCLASGDPIGDVEAWPGAINAWREEAHRHGWRLAVLGASEVAASVYKRDAGLDALMLGDEAIVDIDTFDLKGRAMRGVRQAHARIQRAEYSTTLDRQGEIGDEDMARIEAAADTWRDGSERGFSMALSRLGDAADPDYVLMQCRDGEGRLRAVLGFVPWGSDGLSLDLMRRDRDADNGLFEFMIVELLVRARELGVRRVSLNFAMFREVFANGTRIGAGPVLRMQFRALMVASRWWQLESLYRANRKYQPSWQPRFICFQGAGDLAAVGLAAGRAEGFLP